MRNWINKLGLLVILINIVLVAIIATAEASTIDINYSRTINVVPAYYYGVNDQGVSISNYSSLDIDGDGVATGTMNFTYMRQLYLNLGVNLTRADTDYANTCDSTAGSQENCTNTRSGVSPHNVSGGYSTAIEWLYQNNMKIELPMNFMPSWLANTTDCAAYFPTCPPTNYNTWLTMQINWHNRSLCNFYGNCLYEIHNEPYNTNFWLIGVPTTPFSNIFTRTSNLIYHLNLTYRNFNNSVYGANTTMWGPSLTFNNVNNGNNTSILFTQNMTNTTYKVGNFHPYCFASTGTCNWDHLFDSGIDTFAANGIYNVSLTELSDYSQTVVGQGLSNAGNITNNYRNHYDMWRAALERPSINSVFIYKFTSSGYINSTTDPTINTIMCWPYEISPNNCTPIYWSMYNVTHHFGSGSNIHNTSANSDFFVTASTAPNGSKYLMVGSKRDSTTVALTLNITGVNVNAIIDDNNKTVYTGNNGVFNITSFTPAEVRFFELNYSSTVTPCSAGQYPAFVQSNGTAYLTSNTSCILTGSQPSGGKQCNAAGVCT